MQDGIFQLRVKLFETVEVCLGIERGNAWMNVQ